MQKFKEFFERGNVLPLTLVGSAVVAILAVLSVLGLSNNEGVSIMRIEPDSQRVVLGEEFEVMVVVESLSPVNVFSGELRFDPAILSIKDINYNTSIADLWAEIPWYSNGEGTLNFGGGTTKQGGFQGSGMLIKVTFKTMQTGSGLIALHNKRILLHDGLGTDAWLANSGDSVFFVDTTVSHESRLQEVISYEITPELPTTDLNNDGKQTIADISIFMLNIRSKDPQYDFDQDGEVGIKDLNILLGR